MALVRPARLLSASARRCVQTLDPAAALLDLPIEVGRRLGRAETRPAAATSARWPPPPAWPRWRAAGERAAVCSQGKVLPGALERLAGRAGDFTTPKGGGWLLAFTGDRLLAADRL